MPESAAQCFIELDEVPTVGDGDWRCLKVLMLADDRHVGNVVRDHISAVVEGSRHSIEVINPIHEAPPNCRQLSGFDVILIHYSIFILGDYFLPELWRVIVAAFRGVKAQIIQDEYRLVNAMKERMASLGISVIFSSLEPNNAKKVYGGQTLSGVTVISCLPGYIADYFFTISRPSMAERPLDIVYRGRVLPPTLGRHALNKQLIGEHVKKFAQLKGFKFNISSEEETRIYGDDWFRFLTSGRAMLGVEGGASIFDFDGQVARLVSEFQQQNPEADFHAVWEGVLRPYEGNVLHQTITPKLFEAIAAKTALVLYPGRYRGVLVPGRHFIELKEDASNIEAVFEQLRDIDKLQEMVDLTYDEIMHKEQLSFRYFVKNVDHAVMQVSRKNTRIGPKFLGQVDYLAVINYRIGSSVGLLKAKIISGATQFLPKFKNGLVKGRTCNGSK